MKNCLFCNHQPRTAQRESLDLQPEKPNPHFNKKLCPSCRSLIPLDASSCLVCNNSSFDDLNKTSGEIDIKDTGENASRPVDSDVAEEMIHSRLTNRGEPQNRMTWQFFIITQIVISIVSSILSKVEANLVLFCIVFVTLILLWTINNYLTGQNKYTAKSLWGFINNLLLMYFTLLLFVLALFLAMLIICSTASW